MANRVKSLIESIHQGGSCPRLKIDLTRDGVVCPDFVCEKWGEELIIDLDPSYPLNLAFTAVGVEADLSFGGYVTRCKFPYASIYLIVDRNTGKGELFEDNIPESVRQKRSFTPAPRPSAAKASATPAAKKRPASESRRRRRRRSEDETEADAAPAEASETPKIGLVAVAPAPEPEPPEADADADAERDLDEETDAPVADAPPVTESADESDDDADDDADDTDDADDASERQSETEAQRRRSIFKVIDGGK